MNYVKPTHFSQKIFACVINENNFNIHPWIFKNMDKSESISPYFILLCVVDLMQDFLFLELSFLIFYVQKIVIQVQKCLVVLFKKTQT